MAVNIAALVITLLLSIAVGVVVLAFMIIAMNGYSEGDAVWGLGVFAVLGLFVSVIAGVAAYFFAGALVKKEFSLLLAASVAVPVCTIAAVVLEIITALIGVGVAELVRVNF